MKKTLLAIIIALSISNIAVAQVSVTDSLALVDLYNSTNGPNWTNKTNWLTKSPVSTWYGVSVSSNRVYSIAFYSNNLKGQIPFSIGNLSNLGSLDLSHNQLSGTIPASISNLSNLSTLWLNSNQLSGSIPESIGNLSYLYSLVLQYNQLSGSIPESIGNLSNLNELYLDSNQLSGPIPSSIGNLSNLTWIQLDHNKISGSIPSAIGNLSKLTHLSLNYNLISESIPESISKLSILYTLTLDHNQISGSIPSWIGNLRSLNWLSLSNNQLSGSIPESIGNLYNLGRLSLYNNQISGSIPASIGNLSNLYYLDLFSNQLSGSIPASIGNLTKLTLFGLSSNQLSGPIPASIGNLTKLTSPYLSSNQFTFDGMETVASKFSLAVYTPQANISIHKTNGQLAVSAGGTLKNNTYKWYKNNALDTTIVGDSTYTPPMGGNYSVAVTNAIATKLTLYSDTTENPSAITFYNQVYSNSAIIKLDSTAISNAIPNAIKICADGSKATFIKYYNNDATINTANIGFKIFEDLSGLQKEVYGYFDAPVISNDALNNIKVYYNHPTYMDQNAVYRNITLQVYNKSNGNLIYAYPLEIYRAPLLMVHGLWGKPGSYIEFEKELVDNQHLYPGSAASSPLTLRADYASANSQSFQTNKEVVKKNVQKLLNQVVALNKYSAGKVDIVAHSMGGNLSRLYIQNPYGSVPYLGDVHKLITLNTPHAGTQLADCGADTNSQCIKLVRLRNFFEGNDLYTVSPAINDLRVNSDAIDKYLNGASSKNNALVPTMATSTTLNYSLADPKTECLAVATLTNQEEMYNGEASDVIVPLSSQKANISPEQFTNTGICHVGCMDNSKVQAQVITLINNPPTSKYFDTDGYTPENLVYIPATKKPGAKETNQTIHFIEPSYGAIVKPGQTLKIAVSGSIETKSMELYVGNENLTTTVFDTASNNLTYFYTVPFDAAGELKLMAFGNDSLMHFVFDTLTTFIDPGSDLDSISVYPAAISVPEFTKTSFEVYGHFHDGYTRIISSIPNVEYAVSNPNIAAHTSLNEIEGKLKDTTSLTISYLGISTKVPVEVLDGSEYQHAGFVSFDTLLAPGNTATFNNFSTGNPISYTWQFPGGTPSSSSIENPSIVYKATGQYDVSLIATYANKVDTLTIPNYIHVNSVLPIALLKFTVSLSAAQTAQLLWQTAAEINAKSFTIQRSNNGRDFKSMAILPSKGSNSTYSFVDNLPLKDYNYYRLLITNKDGSNSYSEIRSINITNSFTARLYPNPVNGLLTIELNNERPGKAGITITESDGKTVKQFTIQLLTGNNKITIPVAGLASGTYLLRITTNEGQQVLKFVKE